MHTHQHPRSARIAAALTIAAKLVLMCLLILVVIDPSWGHLEGKAPVARAITYPLWSFAVPAIWLACPTLRRRRNGAYPWMADLLATLPCFTDVLGNRLDLYDTVTAFDDIIHFGNIAMLTAAVVLLTMRPGTGFRMIIERGVATGVTAALAWEILEYVSFLTRSAEVPTAYADTLGDLALGWVGSILGPSAVAGAWWLTRRSTVDIPSRLLQAAEINTSSGRLAGGQPVPNREPAVPSLTSSHSTA